MKYLVPILVVLVASTQLSRADSTATQLDTAINVGAETYAVAFREVGRRIDVWLTVASLKGDRAQRTLARSTFDGDDFERPRTISDLALNDPKAMYNGVPHFNPCDSNEMVFVSDRQSSATGRRSNDIYVARSINGEWKVERATFNSNAWDDTPVFGPGGAYIYFSSDRLSPGSGRADIFRSHRTPTGWTEPVAVDGLANSDRHETSPFVSNGRIYFSTNADGDQDIWTAEIDVVSGKLTSSAEPLTVAGVNAKGSNEYHPVVSPGSGWFYFSSDRHDGPERQFRIYRVALPKPARAVSLRVTARTIIRDEQKRRFFGDLDSISNVQTTVRVRDLNNGTESSLVTNRDGEIDLPLTFSRDAVADPSNRVFIVRAEPPSKSFVSTVDTIVVSTASQCDTKLEHVIYLDDTTTRKRRCEFTFRTFNVPFFVTAYWCPTTRAYRSYTPCASLFTDDLECKNLAQPEHCETNEAYTYTFTPASLVKSPRGAENCVNYREFNDSGDVWAELVDRNIEHMRDEVRSALTDPCLQQAVAEGMPVHVTYVGTTDDRAIHPKCMYTGSEYARIQALAPHIEIDSAIIPFISTNKHFNRGGYGGRAGGNQLLSDLRSLYFAILFDNVCKETIPQYRELQLRGLLRVSSRGQAIDQRDLPYALKRAAGVEIRVPGFEQTFAGKPITGGRKVILCPNTSCE